MKVPLHSEVVQTINDTDSEEVINMLHFGRKNISGLGDARRAKEGGGKWEVTLLQDLLLVFKGRWLVNHSEAATASSGFGFFAQRSQWRSETSFVPKGF